MLTIENPKNFDWANMSLSDCCEGNAMDAYFTLKLFDLVEDKLDDLKVLPFVEKILSDALESFAEMEYEGLLVSTDKLSTLRKELKELTLNQEDALYFFDQVQKTDNLASNNDLIDIFYLREGGFEFYPPDKTAKGSPSVSAPTLKLLLEQINEELTKRS
jgi:DNA polymerase I-like protein with 3'-5' exonuclease and polymerase domains|tara:strand:- start:32554 stop:33033 length:480 start_codon:yes stop_codon:yes gene_type:complete